MRTNEPNRNENALHRWLQHWDVKATLPPGFRREVWQRIEQSRWHDSSRVLARLVQCLEAGLLRPAVALTYLMILLITGSAFGWMQAQRDKGQLDEALERRYVRAIDPYLRLQ